MLLEAELVHIVRNWQDHRDSLDRRVKVMMTLTDFSGIVAPRVALDATWPP